MRKIKPCREFARMTISMPMDMARYVAGQAELHHFGNVSDYFRRLLPTDWRANGQSPKTRAPKHAKA